MGRRTRRKMVRIQRWIQIRKANKPLLGAGVKCVSILSRIVVTGV